MPSGFLPKADKAALDDIIASNDNELLFDFLAEPLHEELYRRQTFDFLEELTDAQEQLISYDYLRNNVAQGGFIQFLVNGYVTLLPEMPAWLQMIGQNAMAQVIDDVLKVYVLNVKIFLKDMTPQEFAGLYDELKEFELLEERFNALNPGTIGGMMSYAKEHLDEYIQLS
jgi:hypothetical protein